MDNYFSEHIWEPIKGFLPRLAIAAAIIVIGMLIQYLVLKWMHKVLASRIDKTMHAFIRSAYGGELAWAGYRLATGSTRFGWCSYRTGFKGQPLKYCQRHAYYRQQEF